MTGIKLINCKKAAFDNVSGVNCGSAVVSVQGTDDLRVNNFRSFNCREGFVAESCGKVAMSNIDIQNDVDFSIASNKPSYRSGKYFSLPDLSEIDFSEHTDTEQLEEVELVEETNDKFEVSETVTIKPNHAQKVGDFLGSLLGSASKSFFT